MNIMLQSKLQIRCKYKFYPYMIFRVKILKSNINAVACFYFELFPPPKKNDMIL